MNRHKITFKLEGNLFKLKNTKRTKMNKGVEDHGRLRRKKSDNFAIVWKVRRLPC